MEKSRVVKNKGARTRHRNAAQRLYGGLIGRLSQITVFDPACGSGNFLYLALQELKDLDHKIGIEAERMGLERELLLVGPRNMCGFDIDDYGVRLARATIWIGQIQWMYKNGYGRPGEPILPPLETIECRDALIEKTHENEEEWKEANWPRADFIVGNPPFLGNTRMITRLGEEYTTKLREIFLGRIPAGADLVTYWFEKARAELDSQRALRVGLVSTNSIRGGRSRKVLERIQQSAVIYNAWSDEKWTIDGSSVRVSLVCFAPPTDQVIESPELNGESVCRINPDLTAGEVPASI